MSANSREAAMEDLRCHRANGVDLNPFSTDGARWSWQRGFDGLPLHPIMGRRDCHERGAAAAALLKGPQ